MANATAALFATALLLLAAASPSGKVSAQIQGLAVSGQLCCAFSGNCQPGRVGIAGVSFRLDCTLLTGTSTYGVGVTNATGGYSLLLPAASLPGIILGPVVPCSVVIPLPSSGFPVCTTLPTVGSLVGSIRVVGLVTIEPLGIVQTATVDPYVRGP